MAASMKKSSFLLEILSLEESQKDIAKIKEQDFSHTLSLILPGENTVPNFVLECFADHFTYRLHRLPVFHLIEMPFIHAFVKKGAIYLTSINRKLDTDDSVAITPNGFLLLSLTKDTYQQLGLEAVKQTPAQRKQDIYVVKINLLKDSFRPGKKGYNRTLWCLKDRLNLVMDLLVAWEPQDANVCSSSIGVYFSDKCQHAERKDLQRTTSIYTSLQCPKVMFDQPRGSDKGCHYRDVYEWIGAMACDIKMDETLDPYISTMTCPEPNINIPRCCLFQASGLLTSKTIERLWKALKQHTLQSQNYPVCLSVIGFSDAIMKNQHEFSDVYISGDNMYSFLLLSDLQCWCYRASGS